MESKRSSTIYLLSGLAAAVAVSLFLGLGRGINGTLFTSRLLIMIIFALSLNLQIGYAGLSNLGHALYFGLGSYGVLIFVAKMHLALPVACLLTLLICTLIALAVGFLTLRTDNLLMFLFLSLGICLLVNTAFGKWAYVGNRSGLTFKVRTGLIESQQACFLLILIVTVLAVVLLYLFARTPFMTVVKGSRENSLRLTFLGVNVNKLRIIVYVVSSFFGVIAGMLYAIMNNGAYITSIDVNMALEVMLMCLIGGGSTFFGPILGALIVTTINNFLPSVTNLYSIIFGVIIILSCYFLPNGIIDPRNRLFRWLGSLRKAEKAGGER